MRGPISRADNLSFAHAMAELPFASIATSALKLTISSLVLFIRVVEHPFKSNKSKNFKKIKWSIIEISSSLVEWIPFLGNYIAIHHNVKKRCNVFYLKNLEMMINSKSLPSLTLRIIASEYKIREAKVTRAALDHIAAMNTPQGAKSLDELMKEYSAKAIPNTQEAFEGDKIVKIAELLGKGVDWSGYHPISFQKLLK
jgi:hypothetical protein